MTDEQSIDRGYVNAFIGLGLPMSLLVLGTFAWSLLFLNKGIVEAAEEMVPITVLLYIVLSLFIAVRVNPETWRDFNVF